MILDGAEQSLGGGCPASCPAVFQSGPIGTARRGGCASRSPRLTIRHMGIQNHPKVGHPWRKSLAAATAFVLLLSCSAPSGLAAADTSPRDTPQFLMQKGLGELLITVRGDWKLHCWHRYREAGESWWIGRCWRIHLREGTGYRSNFINGHGEVILHRSYGLFYVSWSFDLQVFRRGCTPETFIEEEWNPATREYEEVTETIPCAHERIRREMAGERPILLH